MKKVNQNESGFHIVEIVVITLVVGILGFVGWRVQSGKQKNNQPAGQSGSQTSAKNEEKSTAKTASDTPVVWMWSGEKWQANSSAPQCASPLVFAKSPTDVSKASGILYPGQQRSTGYKPHGGFRFDKYKSEQISVVMPIDAHVVSGSRYIEAGETQYMFFFETSCGLAFRFDHLLTLDAKFQALADKLPAAKPDDSRTTNFDMPVTFKTGDMVATAVGFPKMNNASFDFGVYDLRSRNAAAGSAAFVSKHQNELSQAAYGVCWFDMLPSSDAKTVKALPAADHTAGKTSDYCK